VPETGLKIGTIVSAPFGENTYIVHLPGRNDCLVIDPGFEPAPIFEYLERNSLSPAAIVCTHGHCDHIAGNGVLKQRWPGCPIVIGRGDAEKLTNPALNLSGAYGFNFTSPPADKLLEDGDRFEGAGLEFEVRDAPGHSSGHVVFICRQAAPWQVFGGDVLFQEGIGRYDFPDGDFEQLRDSIHRQLFTLPDDTVVLPGHGPGTTIGHEKRANPYVGAAAGYRL